MPSSSLRAGEPIPCCVTDCPNCITPGSAFIMRKRQMKFVRAHFHWDIQQLATISQLAFCDGGNLGKKSKNEPLAIFVSVRNIKAICIAWLLMAPFCFVQADGVSLGGPLCERCVWNRNGPTAFLMTDDVLSMAEIPRGFQPVAHHVMLLALFWCCSSWRTWDKTLFYVKRVWVLIWTRTRNVGSPRDTETDWNFILNCCNPPPPKKVFILVFWCVFWRQKGNCVF